jgi:hypothetical protein
MAGFKGVNCKSARFSDLRSYSRRFPFRFERPWPLFYFDFGLTGAGEGV